MDCLVRAARTDLVRAPVAHARAACSFAAMSDEVVDLSAAPDPQRVRQRRHRCIGSGGAQRGPACRRTSEGSGVDIERYDAAPGRTSLVARIEGSDPDRADAAAHGPHRRRAREPRRLAPRPVRRRAHRRRGVGPRRGRHAQPHRVDGGRHEAPRPRRVPPARHARVPRGRRRGGARLARRRAPRGARGRRGAGRLRDHRVGRHPDPEPRRRQAAGDRGREGQPLGRAAGLRHPRATARSRTRPTTRSSPRRRSCSASPSTSPRTEIHDIWRRFLEGMDYPDELVGPLLDPDAFVDACDAAARRHGPPVPRVHPHDLRADDRPRRHEDQRHPRPRRPPGRHPHAARPRRRARCGRCSTRRSATSPRRWSWSSRTTTRRPRRRSTRRCGTRSAASPSASTRARRSCRS